MNVNKIEKFVLVLIIFLFLFFTSFVLSVFSKDNKQKVKEKSSDIIEVNEETEEKPNKNSNKFKLYLPDDNQEVLGNDNVLEENIINNKPQIIYSKNLVDYINTLNGYIKDNDNFDIFYDVYAVDYLENKINVDVSFTGINFDDSKIDFNNKDDIDLKNIKKLIINYKTIDDTYQTDEKQLSFNVIKELKEINFLNGVLDHDFILDDDTYNVSIDSENNTINLKMIKDLGVFVYLNDEDISDKFDDENVSLDLNKKNNILKIVTTLKTYEFNIIKEDFSYNSLNSLKINNEEITLKNTTNYTLKQKFYTKKINVNATSNNESDIEIVNKDYNIGENILEIKVIKNNLIKKYNIKFNIEKPLIDELSINKLPLEPAFKSDINEYELDVSNLNELDIEAKSKSGNITSDNHITLNDEMNSFYITVKNDDLENNYKFNIKRSINEFKRPLNFGKVTQGFHNAFDIGSSDKSIYGANVYSAFSGKVINILKKSSCGGNIIYISHNLNGIDYTTEYAHLKEILVNINDIVNENSIIGKVGGNPNVETYDKCSTGPHLHYAISKGIYKKGTTEFKKNTNIMLDYNISKIKNEKGYIFYER